jgi:hypothetical protein
MSYFRFQNKSFSYLAPTKTQILFSIIPSKPSFSISSKIALIGATPVPVAKNII